jgi:GntR family transcriptional regulator
VDQQHAAEPNSLAAARLSADDPLPLYYQIRQQIKESIARGDIAPGQALPSERELCTRYGVSRPTVRQALQELLHEGLLERRRGIGTYVTQPKIQHRLGSVLGFSERMEREGRQPSTRLLEQMVIRGSETGAEISAALQIGADARVLRLLRLRCADQEPVILETVHVPLDRFPGLETHDFANLSLYRTLQHHYRIVICHLRETLEPVLLTPDEAALLATTLDRPSMRMVITTYDQAERLVEHTFSLVRGDRFQYYIEFKTSNDEQNGHAHLRQNQLEFSLPVA